MLATAQDLNSLRNKYIHALWGDPDPKGDVLERFSNTADPSYKKLDKKAVPLTPQNILDDVAKFAELSQSLSDWQTRFGSKFGVPPE